MPPPTAQRYPDPTAVAVLDLPSARTVVVEAVLAEWLACTDRTTAASTWAPPAPTPPQGFSSLLDYAIAAEEQRVRVGWSGSAGSDDLAEDR